MTELIAVRLQHVESRAISSNGDNLVAEAMRQMNPDLVAAYPITPQTIIIETFSEFVANGQVTTEFVAVESEHSAMSLCIGAAAAGGRVQTATTSQGAALMFEMLYVASGLRLPIVMHFVNRALSAPINIHCDHSDSMGARDSGWLQLYAENGQEAYDNAIQSVRIAEHPDVMTPILHSQDGFTISHGVEMAHVLPDEAVQAFIGEFNPLYPLLDLGRIVTYGPLSPPDVYMETKRQQIDAMEAALAVIEAVGREFGDMSGRYYGLLDPYRLDDAEYVIVGIGSTCGTARVAVDMMRQEGIAAGLLRVRCYRPFPVAQLAAALRNRRAVAVLDRAASIGAPAHPLFSDVAVALLAHNVRVPLVNYLYGLGGRDTVPAQLASIINDLVAIARSGVTAPMVRYLGIRE